MATHVGESEELGSWCETKRLYNHSKKSNSGAKWSEFADIAMEERRLKVVGESYAIVHRLSRKKSDDGGQPWETFSIEVQSPRLKKILKAVLADYPNWNPDATPFTFFPPFKPFFHRWERISQSFSRDGDATSEMEVALLRDELAPSIEPLLATLEQIKSTGAVSFDNIWMIFSPGDLVVTSHQGQTCISKLLRVEFKEGSRSIFGNEPPYWNLILAHIDWNGSYCGFITSSSAIRQFKESKHVTKFDAFPLPFMEDHEKVRESLLTRGKKFAAYRGCHVKTCVGRKFVTTEDRYGSPKEAVMPVSGRVVIDAYAYYKCQNNLPPTLIRTLSAESLSAEDGDELDGEVDSDEPGNDTPGQDERKEELTELTDLECILASPRVKAFDLKTNEWCELNVDDIEDADWNDSIYDNLVLPQGEKELTMAFLDRNNKTKRGFDDFVRHKGEGIIILLCGPPGVGKTLTAEAVADKGRFPLYMLSAGELGTSPRLIERNLNNALECCSLWGAILLLDEADVFLESRNSNSLERNELVSIFLRRLEYYQGVMFLTTNRISAIDLAFKSRIDLILPYDNLDELARRSVWVNFISRLESEASKIEETDLDELAKAKLNGREIKNTVKTAQVLASREGPLTIEHFRIVLSIRKRCQDFGLTE